MVTSRFVRRIFFIFFLLVSCHLFLVTSASAFTDPLSVPNNKFGIHIISASSDEASPAAQLVNSSGGDWGYITVLVESKNRDSAAWQKFFDDLRKRHLIPIVRLATKPLNVHWERPYEKEEEAWAGFLDSLIWPTENRYVVIYNEPNHGKEWGLTTDPASYAQVLSDTIDALKKKSDDFFVLNAGFDQASPHEPPNFYDEEKFLEEMSIAVPGIFNKLDGWASHSYPNPGFRGLPGDSGRGSVRGWFWELQTLKKYGLTKNLPVFITETGWKHAEGINPDPTLPTSDVVSKHLKDAFQNAWGSGQIAAVTPFLLNYQEPPFDHFSFKKLTGEGQRVKLTSNREVLGARYPEFYSHYDNVADLPKTAGHPVQENKASLEKGEIYNSLVGGQEYSIPLTFKNTGQSIWNEYGQVKLVVSQGLALEVVEIPKAVRVEPNQDYTFDIKLKAPLSGSYKTVLNLYEGGKPFGSKPPEFTTEVKSPVVLVINSFLKWKQNFSGPYFLRISGAAGESLHNIVLDSAGQSPRTEARYLLPGYTFDFTLEKPYYKPKTITQRVESGVNILNFGELEPEILLSLLNPSRLWKILPFSN
ncbi:MAG: Uncharacterized protein CEO21_116 [Microgenomates group bacterium Gr01-1014_80]|nr:MAG: Uncharacterized protein CEO21_116 [Microgenomates group bacterium Gr01-1014_80]